MNKEEAIAELQYLGVGKREYKSLLMVPLVQVAWADGEVVKAERKLLFEIATKLGVHEGDAKGLLDGWIRNGPSDDYGRRARALVRQLAPHNVGLGKDLTREDLSWVIGQCNRVAKAGSGLFGFLRTDPRAKVILDEVADQLHPDSIDWANVQEWEEDDDDDEEEWDEDDDEWEDDDSDEYEDDDSDEQPAGLGLRLGVAKAKVSASTAQKVQKKIQRKKSEATGPPAKKRRVAPKIGQEGGGGGAAVNVSPPGFDDED